VTTLDRGDRLLLGLALLLAAATGAAHYAHIEAITAFVVSAVAIAVLAALVSRAVDQVSERLNPGVTGVLQSALGNLPELFIALFALRAGLLAVATSAVIGSILANILLVLGLAFIAGGTKYGPQRFSAPPARLLVTLMLLSVGAMLLPSLSSALHTPAASHEVGLSRVAAVVLLLVFAASVPASLRHEVSEPAIGSATEPRQAATAGRPAPRWSLGFAVVVLAVTGVLAAVVSDWFVAALQPAIITLHMSQTFAGLVVVAIAGNAVENVVGLRLARQDKLDYALSVIVNSPVQIALVLAPALVLLSPVVGGVTFTLVFSPLLMAAVFIGMLVVTVIVLDGESTWLEGVALVGLYVVIAATFWWG
jgi:Ca2+:H+ antiporter